MSDDHPGMDETQPITGPTGTPPSSEVPPPTTPYGAPPGPGAVPPPQNPYAAPAQNPYAAPQSPYQPPPNPYPQPGSFDQYAPPEPYGAQTYGAYPPGFGAGLPDQPSATTAMVLGIVGLVGIALCGGITLVLSPFAWAIGHKSVREIDANPGRYGGRDKANAGKIMGIIGTVFLIIGIIAIIGIIGLFAAVPDGPRAAPDPVQNGNGIVAPRLTAPGGSEGAADQHRLVDQPDPEPRARPRRAPRGPAPAGRRWSRRRGW